MCVDSIRIEDVQVYTTAQHYAAPGKESFATKSLDSFYIGGMIAFSTFFLVEDSTRNILRGESGFITEKNTAPFLLCPIPLTLQQTGFQVVFSERETHDRKYARC